MIRAQGFTSIGTAIHEVTAALLEPELRTRVLDEALELEGAAGIPDDPLRAHAFVEGPLRLVIKRRVGQSAAEILVETLTPLFVDRREVRARIAAHELPRVGEEDEEETVTDLYDPNALADLRERIRSSAPPPRSDGE